MIGAVEEYVLQNTKKRMNAGELKGTGGRVLSLRVWRCNPVS